MSKWGLVAHRLRLIERAANASTAIRTRYFLGVCLVGMLICYPFVISVGLHIHQDPWFYLLRPGKPVRFLPVRFQIAEAILLTLAISAFLLWETPSEGRVRLLEHGTCSGGDSSE